MTGKIKFEEAMKARIEKMHRPVVDSAEDLQKTEIGGIFCIMSDYSRALIDAHNEVLSMLFNREFERTHGILDKQDVLKVMTALDDKDNEYHEDAVKKYQELVLPEMAESQKFLEAGMNATAINYAGLVLEGKMEPIYDASLEGDFRDQTIETVRRTISDIDLELGNAGAFKETADGKLKLNNAVKTFVTMDEKEEMEEENGRLNNSTK